MTVTVERRLAGWSLAAVLATAVAVNASDYSFLVPLQQVRINTHRAVIGGRAAEPRRQQILVPYLLDPPIRALATVMPPDKALTRVYAVYHLAALTLLLATLFFYLSRLVHRRAGIGRNSDCGQHDPNRAEAGRVLGPVVYSTEQRVCTGIAARTDVHRLGASADSRRTVDWWLAVLIAIAAVNSEAAALLPVLFLATRPLTRDRIDAGSGYAAIWVVSERGGAVVESRATECSGRIGQALSENLQHLPSLAINLALFLGPVCAAHSDWVAADTGVCATGDDGQSRST